MIQSLSLRGPAAAFAGLILLSSACFAQEVSYSQPEEVGLAHAVDLFAANSQMATSRDDATELDEAVAALDELPPLAGREWISFQEETAAAQTKEEPVVDSDWRFSAGLFLWVPSIDGSVTVFGQKSDIDLTVGEFAEAVWNNFSLAAMVMAELRRDDFFFSFAFIYLGLENDSKISTALGTIDVEANFDLVIAEGFVGYEFLQIPLNTETGAPGLALSALAGGRLWYGDLEIKARIGDWDGYDTWFDPAVGLRADIQFNEALSLRMQGDVGGFGIGSDLAWGFRAMLNWRTSESVTLIAGWLILDADYQDGKFEWDIQLSGPSAAAVFTF